MSRRLSILEDICRHVHSLGASGLSIERKDGQVSVVAAKNGTGVGVANFDGDSPDADELLTNLYSAAKRPKRAVLNGQLSLLKVGVNDSFGENAFDVQIEPLQAGEQAGIPSAFTKRQGQYLAYICYYSKIRRRAPAESDIQEYFQVAAPTVHEMIKSLERNGLIQRTPGEARSIRLLIKADHLPALE